MNARQVGKQPAADQVYVGRPSKWGNPFVIGGDGSRDEVIAKYRAWIARQPALMAALHELRAKNLVCWCAPERCHAEVLIELANRGNPPSDYTVGVAQPRLSLPSLSAFPRGQSHSSAPLLRG